MYKVAWLYNQDEQFFSRWVPHQWVAGGVVFVRRDKYVYISDDRIIMLPSNSGTYYFFDDTVAVLVEVTGDVWLGVMEDNNGTI